MKKWERPVLTVLVRGRDPAISVLASCKTGAVVHLVHYDDWMCYGAWVGVGSRGDSCYWDYSFANRKCLVWVNGRRVEGPCVGGGAFYQTCPTRTIASS